MRVDANCLVDLVATLEEGDEREVEPGNESLERPLSRLGFHADESALAHTPGEIKNHVAGLDQDATCEYTDEEDLPDEDLVEQNQAHGKSFHYNVHSFHNDPRC